MDRLSYKLTLMANGGEFQASDAADYTAKGLKKSASGVSLEATLQYEQEIVLPPAPVKTNANFVGWYYDVDFVTPYVAGTKMSDRAVVLYARYEGLESTVNYYDGTTLIKSNGYMYNELFSAHKLPGTPYTTYTVGQEVLGKGYFQGWYYDVDSEMVPFPVDIRISRDEYNLYAEWKPITYTVTFEDSEDASIDYGNATIYSGARNTVARSGGRSLTPAARTGYTFTGWNTQADGSGTAFRDSTSVLGSMTAYAMWEKTPYTVTYMIGTQVDGDVDTAYYKDSICADFIGIAGEICTFCLRPPGDSAESQAEFLLPR